MVHKQKWGRCEGSVIYDFVQAGTLAATGHPDLLVHFFFLQEVDTFNGRNSSIRFAPWSINKRAQLASSHYFTMSIDFGLQSCIDKMVQGLVLSDYSELQIISRVTEYCSLAGTVPLASSPSPFSNRNANPALSEEAINLIH